MIEWVGCAKYIPTDVLLHVVLRLEPVNRYGGETNDAMSLIVGISLIVLVSYAIIGIKTERNLSFPRNSQAMVTKSEIDNIYMPLLLLCIPCAYTKHTYVMFSDIFVKIYVDETSLLSCPVDPSTGRGVTAYRCIISRTYPPDPVSTRSRSITESMQRLSFDWNIYLNSWMKKIYYNWY